MAHFHDNALIGASGQGGYQIERSLRFNSADSATLSKTPASATNRRSWTWSGWVKRSALGTQGLFSARQVKDDITLFGFAVNDRLWFLDRPSGVDNAQLITTNVFRDCSAWYHIVITIDTPNATASDRIRFYVNGVRTTQHDVATYPSQNYEIAYINNTQDHRIGTYQDTASNYFNGYLTEINFIDGQALTPSSFGETDTITGVWKPKRYAGTYGTNGFYLKFADNSGTTSTTLGKDSSGNGNNFTPNNFSVTAGAGNDSLIDSPTPYADGGNGRGNYCTWNPLKKNSGVSFPNGNLDFSGPGTAYPVFGNIAMTTGKWYWENLVNSNDGGDYPQFGVVDLSANENDSANLGSFRAIAYRRSGAIRKEGTDILSGRPTFTNGDVISVAFDASTGKVWFAKNGTWVNGSSGSAGDPAAGTNEVGSVSTAIQGYVAGAGGYSSATFSVNFGQRPFAYTPPSGFLALNTQNLPEPSIKKPNQWMDINLATGNNSTQTITNAGGFQPDLVWMKIRSAAENHILYDSARGTDNFLVPNLTNAAAGGGGQGLTSFNSNGFTLGSINPNYAGSPTFVAWQWKKSATPGFDIVTYTGNGTNRTIAHSLGVAPSMMIVKNRSLGTEPWRVYHQNANASPATGVLNLNTTAAFATSSTQWNNTAPTSSVFSVGTDDAVNRNGDNYVAYLWSEVAGFSKFGSYSGTGSADGAFIYTGFRPAYVLIKCSSNITSWWCYDNKRDTYNEVSTGLVPNATNADTGGYPLDFLSNGFKFRNSNGDFNGSGRTYIFGAWAENPFKYSLAR